jgi:glycosyltransferase involved in cell wall biosynthesis
VDRDRQADGRHFCVVTETYPPEVNGVAHTLGHLVHGLRERGHHVSLVHPRRPHVEGRSGVDVLGTTLVAGVAAPGYPGVRIGLPARGLVTARWSRHRPDAVYVATPGPLGWSAIGVARRLRIPVVSGFHTNFHRYAGHYHAGWLRALVTHGLRRFHNATTATLVATDDLREELAAGGFRNLHVLGRGVDTHLFAPGRRSTALRAVWGAGDDDRVAVHVGRIAAEKNLGLAVEAYRALRHVGAAHRLVIVGDGPQREALQRAHPDLVFTGMQSGEALAAHYASADLFLFPSETETFGNVVLEAMASGVALVAYDYAAARVHVTDGATGGLAPLGDPAAFVQRALALARSPELPALRRRARAAALDVAWPRVVHRFETLLLGGRETAETVAPDLVAP